MQVLRDSTNATQRAIHNDGKRDRGCRRKSTHGTEQRPMRVAASGHGAERQTERGQTVTLAHRYQAETQCQTALERALGDRLTTLVAAPLTIVTSDTAGVPRRPSAVSVVDHAARHSGTVHSARTGRNCSSS